MERLPYIDEYAIRVEGPADRTWVAITRALRGQAKGLPALVRVLGATPGERSGDWNGDLNGATIPGFEVVDAQRPERLELRGRHRFARYSLVFLLDGERVRAQTYAEFPGLKGRAYRALVISSGAHRLVAQRLLRRVAATR
jgi:hypothetical protein